ncbi:hypothetical protein Tco_0858891 [Tanacetum coccineum]|uniref:Uncharacterized protein n=1 Tax=Tanacetum coccineum TaxID=301880 RepID=A0ABQ5BEG2_9ASTR
MIENCVIPLQLASSNRMIFFALPDDLIAFDQVSLDADCLFQNETKNFQSVVTLKVLNLEGDICSKAQEDSSYKEIPVGVILDMGSWVGKIVHSCMNMALSDFYTVNNHYKTRIVIHSRDTHGEPLHALSAGSHTSSCEFAIQLPFNPTAPTWELE